VIDCFLKFILSCLSIRANEVFISFDGGSRKTREKKTRLQIIFLTSFLNLIYLGQTVYARPSQNRNKMVQDWNDIWIKNSDRKNSVERTLFVVFLLKFQILFVKKYPVFFLK